MKIPRDEAELILFTREVVEQCLVSRESRRLLYGMMRRLFFMGSLDGVSKHNRCYSHVDKLSSYLFSPVDVRFDIELESGNTKAWESKLGTGGRYLNRRFNKTNCGLAFGQANEAALIDGCCFVKLVWGPNGFEPWVIRPEFMGVYREDIADLDRQEAFVHTFYVTKDAFRRLVANHPDKDELTARAARTASGDAINDITDSYLHEMVLGGPISVPGTNSVASAAGQVGVVAPPAPMLNPEVAADLIRIDDLWVWDDDLSDWTTIRYVEPGMIIEGRYQRRNLSDIPKRHPFFKVCSNEIINYFWGRSELATVYQSQLLLNARVNDIDAIFRLQAKPPRAFTGFQGITDEKARALLSGGGSIVEGNMNAKVENLAPDMPPNALEYISMLDTWFDEAAGFTNILSGQGEPGIRAGVHADTILRTSAARLRDRSLLVEKQCADFGNGCLKMLTAKVADVLTTDTDEEFMLNQLPKDAYATVDSHSSSPAFSEENKQLAFALAKAGVIDGEDLLEAVQPPRLDILLSRYRQRQAAQAEYVRQNPGALEDLQGKKKK